MELSQDHTSWTEYDVKNSYFLVQPSVIRPTPSKSFLRAFFRDRRAEHIYSATSSDEGNYVHITFLPSMCKEAQSLLINANNIITNIIKR